MEHGTWSMERGAWCMEHFGERPSSLRATYGRAHVSVLASSAASSLCTRPAAVCMHMHEVTLDAGRWTLDAGRWTLDVGRCLRLKASGRRRTERPGEDWL